MGDQDKKGKGGSGVIATLIDGIRKLAEASRNKTSAKDAASEDRSARAKAQGESWTPPDVSGPASTIKPGQIKLKISPDDRKKENQKKWLVVAAVIFAIILFFSFLASRNQAPVAPPKPADAINMMPESALKESFETKTQTNIQKLTDTTNRELDSQKQTDAALEEIRNRELDQERTLDQIKGMIGSISTKPPAIPDAPSPSGAIPPPPEPIPGNKKTNGTPPPMPAGETTKGDETTHAAPQETSEDPLVISPGGDGGSGSDNKGRVGAHQTYERNPMAGYLTSGAFAPTVLLTGIEAGTASTSQSNPQPVLMRVERDAVLPGFADYQVAACFVLGSATGSLSSERANILLARISCIDSNQHLVIDAAIKGYVVDSDGMFGLRGKLVEREGAVLGKALLAGFASGLSSALGQAQGTVSTSALGVTSAFSGSSALKGAAFGGGSNAANQLASFYLKQAESIFPTIEVEPKRKAALVITDGATLEWNDYGSLYIKKITPEGK